LLEEIHYIPQWEHADTATLDKSKIGKRRGTLPLDSSNLVVYKDYRQKHNLLEGNCIVGVILCGVKTGKAAGIWNQANLFQFFGGYVFLV
jgi:hypothetical protein